LLLEGHLGCIWGHLELATFSLKMRRKSEEG
jgi:hypothetical protein